MARSDGGSAAPMGVLRIVGPPGSRIQVFIDGKKAGAGSMVKKLGLGLYEVRFVGDAEQAIRVVSLKQGKEKTLILPF